MRTVENILVPLFAAMILLACNNQTMGRGDDVGDTVQMKYAQNICMVRYDGYTKVELANPWKEGSTLHTYILINRGAKRVHLPAGTVVEVPLQASAVSSGVHGGLICELGGLNQIRSVFEIEYYTNKDILQAYRKGRIKNLGSSLTPSIEAVIDAHPDALLLSPFENSGGYGQIENLDIPIIECADYMETSSLGRAEWMKFYGLLYGKAKEADSLFTSVEKEYNRLKALVADDGSQPTVISDLITGSTWYVPGGNSTIGKLIVDAGGRYIFSDNNKSGSLSLAPELVFDKAHEADVWFFKYTQPTDITYTALAAESPMYSQIKAFKQKLVYGCNLSYVPFYNDLPYHPERHLRELIKMFHPDALPDYQLKYYKPVADQ